MPDPIIPLYPEDLTGTAPTNLVVRDPIVITGRQENRNCYFVIPTFAPFYTDGVSIELRQTDNTVIQLNYPEDYYFTHRFMDASLATYKNIYGSITLNKNFKGVLYCTYQTIGGQWTLDQNKILEILNDYTTNPRVTTWEQVADYPECFNPEHHPHPADDIVGYEEFVDGLVAIEAAIRDIDFTTTISSHLIDYSNPHKVTALQVGLPKVRNLATIVPEQAALDFSDNYYVTPKSVRNIIESYGIGGGDGGLGQIISDHIADTGNPHHVTAGQTGAYTKAETDTFLNTKLGKTDTAANSTKFSGMTYAELGEALAIRFADAGIVATHLLDTVNPHQVTAEQISVYTKAQIDAFNTQLINAINDHRNNYDNPHQTTAAQVGAYTKAQVDGLLQTEQEKLDKKVVIQKPTISPTNWNLLLVPGMYSIETGVGVTGFPGGANGAGILSVFGTPDSGGTNNQVGQLYFSRAGRLYIRVGFGGVNWTAWQEILFLSDFAFAY